MIRPHALLLCLALATPAFATAAFAQPAKLSQIVVAYQPGDANSQGIVKQQGWFASVDGTPVVYKDFNSGADVYRAMASGAVDMGLIGNAPFTIAVTQGAPYTAVWWYDIGTTAEGLVVRADSPIKAVADLKGHKVATPFGSTSDFMLHGTLDAAGLKPQEARLINLAPQAILAAWSRGDIDAAYIWEPVLGQLSQQGGKVIAVDKDLLARGYLAGDVGFVKTSLLTEHPDVVRAWMKANIRAIDLIHADPAQAEAIAAQAYSVSPADIKAAFDGDLFPTAQDQLGPEYLGGLGDQLDNVAKLLASENLVPAAAAPAVYKAAVSVAPLQDAMAH